MEKKTITITKEKFDEEVLEVVDEISTDKEGKTNPMAFMLGAMVLAKLSYKFFGEEKSLDKPQQEKVGGEA